MDSLLKLYDSVTGRQVASESIAKLRAMSLSQIEEFFALQHELGRTWDINIQSLINK